MREETPSGSYSKIRNHRPLIESGKRTFLYSYYVLIKSDRPTQVFSLPQDTSLNSSKLIPLSTKPLRKEKFLKILITSSNSKETKIVKPLEFFIYLDNVSSTWSSSRTTSERKKKVSEPRGNKTVHFQPVEAEESSDITSS